MKISIAALLALPLSASAFSVYNPQAAARSSTRLSLSAVVTGPKGKAASSAEEDLLLTLQVIMDHQDRSTTTSKEQFVQQMEQVAATPEPEAPVDISVPYDAAARLAFEASDDDKSMSFEDFKVKYIEDSVALVKSKQPVDVSIPYDAAAKLAFETAGGKGDYAAFKTKFEADAVADVIAKQPAPAAPKAAAAAAAPSSDISIPYDAAAKLAYDKAGSPGDYAAFKTKYEADAVADVIAKQQ